MSACLQDEALAIDSHADTRRKLGTKGAGRSHNRLLHPCVSFWPGADCDEGGEGLRGHRGHRSVGRFGCMSVCAALAVSIGGIGGIGLVERLRLGPKPPIPRRSF
jgi:hypothetical protein